MNVHGGRQEGTAAGPQTSALGGRTRVPPGSMIKITLRLLWKGGSCQQRWGSEALGLMLYCHLNLLHDLTYLKAPMANVAEPGLWRQTGQACTPSSPSNSCVTLGGCLTSLCLVSFALKQGPTCYRKYKELRKAPSTQSEFNRCFSLYDYPNFICSLLLLESESFVIARGWGFCGPACIHASSPPSDNSVQ